MCLPQNGSSGGTAQMVRLLMHAERLRHTTGARRDGVFGSEIEQHGGKLRSENTSDFSIEMSKCEAEVSIVLVVDV